MAHESRTYPTHDRGSLTFNGSVLPNRVDVGSVIHQILQLGSIVHLDLGDPAGIFRTLVDRLGLIFQDRVALNHPSGDRRQDLRGGLDGFDSSDGLAGAHLDVGGGQLNVDDVSERLGGVFRDADSS